MKRIVLFCLLAMLWMQTGAWGATYYAKPSGTNPSTAIQYKSGASGCSDASGWTDNSTLQIALTALGATGTFNVCPGTYTGTMINDSTHGLTIINNGVTLAGAGSSQTILDYSGITATCLLVNGGVTGAKINGLTIKNGASNQKGLFLGGGSTTINDVVLDGNGVALYMQSADTTAHVLNDLVVKNSTSTSYWGINFSANNSATFNYPIFSNNKTGFRVYNSSNLTWNNPDFIGDQATSIFTTGATGTPVVVVNNPLIAGSKAQSAVFTNAATVSFTVNNPVSLPTGYNPITYPSAFGTNITVNNSIVADPKYKTPSKEAIVVFQIDDDNNVQQWLDVSNYAYSHYGYKTTYSLWGGNTLSAQTWLDLAARVANGHELSVHGQNRWDTMSHADAATDITTNITAIQTNVPGYTVTTAAYPGGFRSADNISYLQSLGLIGARAVNDANTTLSLEVSKVFELQAYDLPSTVGTTNIATNIAAILHAAANNGWIVVFMGHAATEYSLASWQTLIDTVASMASTTTRIRVMTLHDAITYIKANGSTADGGLTYTRTITSAPDYHLLPGSPAINAGANLCATLVNSTDYDGNAVCSAGSFVGVGSAPDIGAYEFQMANAVCNSTYTTPRAYSLAGGLTYCTTGTTAYNGGSCSPTSCSWTCAGVGGGASANCTALYPLPISFTPGATTSTLSGGIPPYVSCSTGVAWLTGALSGTNNATLTLSSSGLPPTLTKQTITCTDGTGTGTTTWGGNGSGGESTIFGFPH